MVTGRISLRAPEYSPISSSVSEVRLSSSSLPLPGRDRVGHQDQRGRLGPGHRGRADERLAGAAGQHDDAGAAVPEAVDGLAAGRAAASSRPASSVDRVRLAVDVPGQVLGRPAELEQHLLEVAALGRVHGDVSRGRSAAPTSGCDLLASAAPPRAPGRRWRAAPGRAPGASPAAAGRTGPSSRRRRPAARAAPGSGCTCSSDVDHLLGVVPGGPRVPQAQRGQPVGVHVLGRALQLGERRDRRAGTRRASAWSTSSSSVLSLWTISGPSGAAHQDSLSAPRPDCQWPWQRAPMSRTVQIVFDAADPAKVGDFWAAALGYVRESPPEGFDTWPEALQAFGVPEELWDSADAVVDPDGSGPRLFIQKVPEAKTVKNRVHLDIRVSDPGRRARGGRRRRAGRGRTAGVDRRAVGWSGARGWARAGWSCRTSRATSSASPDGGAPRRRQ